MKLFLFRFCSFLIVITIIGISINIFQSRYNNSQVHYKLKYNAINNSSTPFNAIIIGSSHSAHSIKPSLLSNSNISYYNFALNGANPKFYSDWYLKLFRKKHPSPKYCIIGIDWFMFDGKWLWRKFEQDSEYFTSELFLKLLLLTSNIDKKCLIDNRYPIIKYRQAIQLSLKRQRGDTDYPINTYENGYIAYQPTFNLAQYNVNCKVNIDLEQVYYFKKLIANFISENVKIIFIMTPEYNIAPEKYSQMKSLSIINAIAIEYKIPILNFNTDLRNSINNNIDYFSDWGHMNDKGAILFSTLLSKKLIQLQK